VNHNYKIKLIALVGSVLYKRGWLFITSPLWQRVLISPKC